MGGARRLTYLSPVCKDVQHQRPNMSDANMHKILKNQFVEMDRDEDEEAGYAGPRLSRPTSVAAPSIRAPSTAPPPGEVDYRNMKLEMPAAPASSVCRVASCCVVLRRVGRV